MVVDKPVIVANAHDRPERGFYERLEAEDAEWNPEAAHEAFIRQQTLFERHCALKQSVESMLGTATVNECNVAYFDHDPESSDPPIVQYCEHLEAEAYRALFEMRRYGGQTAVQDYVRMNAAMPYAGEVTAVPKPHPMPVQSNYPA